MTEEEGIRGHINPDPSCAQTHTLGDGVRVDEWASARESWRRLQAAWSDLRRVQRRGRALRLVERAIKLDPTFSAWLTEQVIETYIAERAAQALANTPLPTGCEGNGTEQSPASAQPPGGQHE